MRKLTFSLSLLLVFAMLYYAMAVNWSQNPGAINENSGNLFASPPNPPRAEALANPRAHPNTELPVSVPAPDTMPQMNPTASETKPAQNVTVGRNAMTNIIITVNGKVFSAKIYENSAARALLALFPVTLNMSDLNGNEKYCRLVKKLPSASTERPATINAGDIMCWSGDTLVLFYKTFSNSYGGYVRLGYVEDVSGFAAALGSGSVQISFAIRD